MLRGIPSLFGCDAIEGMARDLAEATTDVACAFAAGALNPIAESVAKAQAIRRRLSAFWRFNALIFKISTRLT